MGKKKYIIGGQAVIEGVLMKSPNYYNISIRKGKKIISKKEKLRVKKNWEKLFFIRGIINLWEMLSVGIKALTWSAEQSEGEEEKIGFWGYFITVLLSIVLFLFIFKFIPFIVAKFFSVFLGEKFVVFKNSFIFNLIEGVVKLFIFIMYVYLISLMKDVKKIFEYHGAEHNVVNAYEHDEKLTLKNVRKYTTIHKRCGTNFIFFVIFISIIVYLFLPSDLVWYVSYGLRVLLLPVIVGISYELLKLSSVYKRNVFFKILSYPGLWIQKITTKEPTNKQLEVAIDSLKTVLKLERN